jgi:membrane protein YqaA with SNARE-associated domain
MVLKFQLSQLLISPSCRAFVVLFRYCQVVSRTGGIIQWVLGYIIDYSRWREVGQDEWDEGCEWGEHEEAEDR